MKLPNIQHTVLERFLRYVQIDTQSNPQSTTYPSTQKQKNLSALLVSELQALGINDAHEDEWGLVYATIPATSTKKNVPTICFCSHLDTAPDCSGKDVKPIVHKNYNGNDIVLPDNPSVIIKLNEHPDLAQQIGNDIITASGNTLLGADNKAGIAEIVDAAAFLMQHPELPHGEIKILFTPDEEIGAGAQKVNLIKLNARYGYTVDGESLGAIEDETFSADKVTINLKGLSAHPGFAKGKMENAIKIAAEIINRLPKTHLSPETTEQKQGFIHPIRIEGIMEEVVLEFIIRDFEEEQLNNYENILEQAVISVLKNYPNSSYQFKVEEQYRNLKAVLNQHPQVVNIAIEAIKRAGLQPLKRSVRGGTDGSRLSFMGLPCPNLFAGEHSVHAKTEWVSLQDMQKAVETIVHICLLWEEKTI